MEKNRNSKCYCGSGKKYKKCCLENDSFSKIVTNKSEIIKNHYSNLYKTLYTYASKRKDFNNIYEDATNIFFPKKFDNNEDMNIIFNAYFLRDYVIQDTKTTLALDFYETYVDKLSVEQINLLYSIITSYISLYSIEYINKTKIIISDAFTGKHFEILDNILSKSLSVGDKIVANVMTVGGINIISELLFRISSQNIFDNLFQDLKYLYDTSKDTYNCFEDFLRNNTLLFYYHIMQIISPEAYEFFKEFNKLKEEISLSTNKDVILDSNHKYSSINLSNEVFDKIDTKYITQVLDVLSSSIEDNTLNKTSESGWVSAAEYHVKKIAGINVTQSQIAEKYSISTSTLGKRYKIVKEISL